MTLANAKKRAEALGYEVEKGQTRKYRFRKFFSLRWQEIDDLYTALQFMGDKTLDPVSRPEYGPFVACKPNNSHIR